MKDKHVGLIAMLVAALGLAIAVVLMKVIPQYTQLPPQHIAIWRFTLATPPLLIFLAARRGPKRMLPRQPWWFLILGLTFSVASFSAIFALQRLSSSIYVIVLNFYPSLVMIYTLLTGGAVPRIFWLGLPLTLLGLVLTAFDFGSVLAVDPLGLVITLVNALALAAFMLISAWAFRGLDKPLTGTLGVMLGGMAVGLLLIPLLGISMPANIKEWLLLFSFSLFGTLMPIMAMNFSLKYIGAARGSIIVTVQPVLTILIAMVFLNETLTLQQWFGGALVILSIVLMQRSPDRLGKPVAEGQPR
jgi:drug/metabolite transporter (DMT)-like permease